MYSPEQLEIIHLQDSYTIMYALLARQIINALGEVGDSIVREATERTAAESAVRSTLSSM